MHDLAAEFGVPVEQLMGTLREMNIFVRSHMSALEPDQVSAVRVRWEREKRKAAEPATPRKGRRKTAAPATPVPAQTEAKPARRRRTAADVAEQEAKAAQEAEDEAANPSFDPEKPVTFEEQPTEAKQTLSLEERAKMLFKDLPAMSSDEPPEAVPGEADAAALRAESGGAAETVPASPPASKLPPIPPRPPRPALSLRPAAPTPAATSGTPAKKPFIPPRVQRPAPPSVGGRGGSPRGGPGGPGGPRPVFSSSSPQPARPASSGAGGPA
ncbi:MAG: translation initiation factor IF-2 N-terminal domain-containing protein, partial [Candidatus Eisenbacteria bacterium]